MICLAPAFLVVACGAPAPSPGGPSSATAAASSERPPQPHARATRCSATPSTVYGDEPVSFAIEGRGDAAAALDATLYDRAARVVAQATTRVPGQLGLPDVPSGDFLLSIGPERVSCWVTVNRELSRATPGRN
jgi:hypothetical protein